MKTNIEISGINKHFLFENVEIEGNNNNNIKYRTKIVNYCFSSVNEANISDIIKKIPYYSNNYSIIEEYDFLNINQLNEKTIEKLEINDNIRYLLFKYKRENSIKFNDFIFNLRTPKILIFNVIESFSNLLKSLIELNDNNICFFNLSHENIIFNLDSREKPIIQNFTSSLQISKINLSYITNIIKNLDNYTLKPLEFHILFYFIQNDISTISLTFIEEVCEVFMKNLSILDLFSEKFRYTFKISCVESLKKYINKPKNDIIAGILTKNNKWDVYSLSLLYLHIFCNISRVFSLKDTFITKFSIELLKNIAPDPSKRNSLGELSNVFHKLLKEEKDWSYVNNLDNDKFQKLFEILDR